MYTLFFYVPESHLEAVKTAVFAVGAGAIGDYQSCCWQVLGLGQFMPMAGSQPFIGKQNQLEKVAEWRVEMVVAAEYIKATIAALKLAHPYEEPAYAVYELANF